MATYSAYGVDSTTMTLTGGWDAVTPGIKFTRLEIGNGEVSDFLYISFDGSTTHIVVLPGYVQSFNLSRVFGPGGLSPNTFYIKGVASHAFGLTVLG